MLRLQIKTNFPEVNAALKRGQAEIHAAFARGLRRGAVAVQRDAMLRLTTNGSVNFGLLRASIGTQIDEAKLQAWVGPGLGGRKAAGLSGDPVNYGYYVEHGRRAGRRPPPIALALWVRRRLGVSDPKQLRRVTYLVGRKIAQRGIRARPFLRPAIEGSAAAVRILIASEIDKTIKELNARR